jgi:hypothetical protein
MDERMKKVNGHFRYFFDWRRTLLILTLLTPLPYTSGCNADSSAKRLDESSAKELVLKHTSNLTFKIPLNPYLPLLGRTLTDRSAPTGTTIQDSIFQHLIQQGYVLQNADIIQYPAVSGVFSGRKDCGQGMDCFTKREFKLQMVPNSNNLVGEATELHQHWTNPASHNVTGTIEPDGTVAISDPMVGLKGTYKEQGASAYLEIHFPINGDNEPSTFVGPATGRKVEIKWYTYSWSPEFQQKIVRGNNVNAVIGGGFEIGAVSDLRLIAETEASAYVTYTGVLDKIGKTFYPASPPNGRWQVLFGKKPDGTWFVDQLH